MIADYWFGTWTCQIPDTNGYSTDAQPFDEPIYSVFNVHLLDLLTSIGPKQAIW